MVKLYIQLTWQHKGLLMFARALPDTVCLICLSVAVGPCCQVVAGTWNVNENKPSRPGLERWLGERVRDAQLVLIGLQVSRLCRHSWVLVLLWELSGVFSACLAAC